MPTLPPPPAPEFGCLLEAPIAEVADAPRA